MLRLPRAAANTNLTNANADIAPPARSRSSRPRQRSDRVKAAVAEKEKHLRQMAHKFPTLLIAPLTTPPSLSIPRSPVRSPMLVGARPHAATDGAC
jgi:hypothetical protein